MLLRSSGQVKAQDISSLRNGTTCRNSIYPAVAVSWAGLFFLKRADGPPKVEDCIRPEALDSYPRGDRLVQTRLRVKPNAGRYDILGQLAWARVVSKLNTGSATLYGGSIGFVGLNPGSAVEEASEARAHLSRQMPKPR